MHDDWIERLATELKDQYAWRLNWKTSMHDDWIERPACMTTELKDQHAWRLNGKISPHDAVHPQTRPGPSCVMILPEDQFIYIYKSTYGVSSPLRPSRMTPLYPKTMACDTSVSLRTRGSWEREREREREREDLTTFLVEYQRGHVSVETMKPRQQGSFVKQRATRRLCSMTDNDHVKTDTFWFV